MKRKYVKPQFVVVELQHKELILDASPLNIKSVSANVDLGYIGDDSGYYEGSDDIR